MTLRLQSHFFGVHTSAHIRTHRLKRDKQKKKKKRREHVSRDEEEWDALCRTFNHFKFDMSRRNNVLCCIGQSLNWFPFVSMDDLYLYLNFIYLNFAFSFFFSFLYSFSKSILIVEQKRKAFAFYTYIYIFNFWNLFIDSKFVACHSHLVRFGLFHFLFLLCISWQHGIHYIVCKEIKLMNEWMYVIVIEFDI